MKIKEEELKNQRDFCKKNCGEKLFKNLDLSQRFYLKKNKQNQIHHEKCFLFKRKILVKKESNNTSTPLKFREKRRSEVEKNISLLDFSLIGMRSNSVFEDNKEILSKIEEEYKINRTLIEDKNQKRRSERNSLSKTMKNSQKSIFSIEVKSDFGIFNKNSNTTKKRMINEKNVFLYFFIKILLGKIFEFEYK